MAHGEGFSWRPVGTPTAQRPPLYPLLLSAVRLATDAPRAGLMLQSLFDVATCWLVCVLGRRLFGGRTGLLAAAMWALYPVGISQADAFWTEPLCALLITLGLVLLACRRKWFPAGLALGLAAITRPPSLVAALFLGGWHGLTGRRAWRR